MESRDIILFSVGLVPGSIQYFEELTGPDWTGLVKLELVKRGLALDLC